MRWIQKPPVGTLIDRSHPLAQGLMGLWPLNEGTGAPTDVITGLGTTIEGSGGWGAAATGRGFQCTASGSGAYALLPSALRFASYPATVVCGFVWNGSTPTGNANLFGFASNNTGTGVIINAAIRWDQSSLTIGAFSANFTFPAGSGFLPTAGTEVVLGLSILGNSSIALYAGGKAVYTNAATGGTAPSWTSTANTSIGQQPGLPSRTPQGTVTWAGAWTRALSASEHAALAANPWQVFVPPRDAARLYAATSGLRISYPRASSALRPLHLPTADLYCYLD